VSALVVSFKDKLYYSANLEYSCTLFFSGFLELSKKNKKCYHRSSVYYTRQTDRQTDTHIYTEKNI